MGRSPMPPLGVVFDASFSDVLLQAHTLNPAIHDGAIMLLRGSASESYKIAGWSYRLTPPFSPEQAQPNRGSAYNSAFAMSKARGVDAVAIAAVGTIEMFVAGKQVRAE